MARTNLPSTEFPPNVKGHIAKLTEHDTALDALEAALQGAVEVTGARDDGTALASLLTVLEAAGIITDSTTAS